MARSNNLREITQLVSDEPESQLAAQGLSISFPYTVFQNPKLESILQLNQF